MGFKRFGKLAGNTSAAAVLASSAPANTLTPFVAQPDGAKFLAYGEGASSAAFNRIATALQENIEQLAGVLDTPALADTRIMALDTVSYGSAGTVDLANGTADVDLAAFSAGLVPVTWVYTGLHENRLGDFIKMYRQPASTQAGQQAYEEINPVTAAQMGAVIPITAAKDLTAWPIFLDPNDVPASPAVQTYLHAVAGGFQSPHSLALFIPPIAAVASDLPPYGGVAISPLVSRWWNDGIAPTTYSWNDMYMRPGCFVHIKLGGVNNGLYRIARNTHNQTALSSDKAVLTRGGLHKVSVVSTAGFTAGRLLCWSSYPDNASIIIPLDEKPNFAYCVFVDNAVGQEALYLAEVGGEEDFPTYASGSIYGQKVDQTSGTYGTASALGDVGEVDYETSAGSSISLRVGTMLYDAANALLFSEVLAVIPAHYPVQFDVNVAAGATFTPCSPLGFTLNPTLRFTAGDITGGSYIVHCKTLTTAREKLTSYGANGRWQIVPNPSDKLDHSAFEAGQVRAFARYLKTGDESATTRGNTSEYPSGPFAAPAMLLGDNTWQVTVVTVPPAGAELEDSLIAVHGAVAGAPLVITPSGFVGTTRAIAEACSGNVLVFRDVHTANWAPDDWLAATSNTKPVGLGSTFVKNGVTYSVSALTHMPYVRDGSNIAKYPFQGLYGAYLNSFSATKDGRHTAGTTPIVLENGSPVTLYKADTVLSPAVEVLGDSVFDSALLRYESVTAPANYAEVSIKDVGGSAVLALGDTNTAAQVPLSDTGAENSALRAALPQNLIGAINAPTRLLDQLVSNAIVSGCAVTATAPPALEVDVAQGVVIKDGAYHAVDAVVALPVGANSTFYLVWNGTTYVTTTNAPTASQAPLAKIVTGPGTVTSITDMRLMAISLNERDEITVGGPGAHFDTLAAAVQFVNALDTPATGDPNRTYNIVIRGPLVETGPITFYAGNVSIRGMPGSAALNGATITWSGNVALFSLNGQSNISFSDLSICYDTNGAAASNSTFRTVFLSGTGTATSIRINNVDIWATTSDRLHGYMLSSGAGFSDLQVTGGKWMDATTYGVLIYGSRIRFKGCRIIGANNNPQAHALPPGGMSITGGASSAVWISDCSVEEWSTYGIYVEQAYNFNIRGCYVNDVLWDVSGGGAHGIFVHDDAYRGSITDNSVLTITGGAATASGVTIEGERCILSGNMIEAMVSGGFQYGIRLAGTSQYCIVLGNQTSSDGVSDVGANNGLTVGTYAQLNRDDA